MPGDDDIDIGVFDSGTDAGLPSLLGQTIAHRYRLETELGRGGMGVVYLAQDLDQKTKVALKMLAGAGAKSPEIRQRFRREAETASKLNHPGICAAHDFGEHEGLPFLTMDYLRGSSLSEILQSAQGKTDAPSSKPTAAAEVTMILELREREESGAVEKEDGVGTGDGTTESSMSVDVMVRLVEQTARALHVAHEAGLVHRDIKPGNIMITLEGDPVLLDFGLARDVESAGQTLTQSGQIIGTPAYLAPEQIVGHRAQIDRRADVYALGVTLYECLTLRRPFVGSTWDQLFHQILSGAWESPLKLNPHIPRELCTVVEKALDRDAHRRYQTAEELADDLRRVRAFEPIVGRLPAWPVRARRWARRRPVAAVGIAVATLAVMMTIAFVAHRAWWRSVEFKALLSEAEEHLQSGEFEAARKAVAQALIFEPDARAARELRVEIERGSAYHLAGAAREEARTKTARYAVLIKTIAGQEDTLVRERKRVFQSHATETQKGRFAAREAEISRSRVEAERLIRDARGALERARRAEAPHGGPSEETSRAFAAFYFERFSEALAVGNAAGAAWFADATRSHDRTGEFADRLAARGRLVVDVSPSGARVYLHRYVTYDDVRPDDHPVPRLVPAPTSGLGLLPFGHPDGARPGDPCFVIRSVTDGSPAARAGVGAGDLVVAINGTPCAPGLFVRGVADGARGRSTGDAVPLVDLLPIGARIVAMNGMDVQGSYDWAFLPPRDRQAEVRLSVAGQTSEVVCARGAVLLSSAKRMLTRPAPGALRVTCLGAGELRTLVLKPGEMAGFEIAATSYPLFRREQNRLEPGSPIEVEPGSYLIDVHHDGFEAQRVPVLIGRDRSLRRLVIELASDGSAPPGFVYVPAGPFVAGGDPDAFNAGQSRIVDLDGFHIGRKEVTTAEWLAFVNDPETRKAIVESNETRYVPRESTGVMVSIDSSSNYVPGNPARNKPRYFPATPALGISHEDVRDFIAWRNRKAAVAGERWMFDLPTSDQWEKAARGVDGRHFPWGNRFDFSLTVGAFRKWGDQRLFDAPGGFEPRDESPYGVLDMAGSRREWVRDSVPDQPVPTYHVRGGTWGSEVVDAFRVAARGHAPADQATGTVGFRLVARPLK